MITRLEIENFKKFGKKELDFQPGLNVVWGKNEAGKTTTMQALTSVLFVDATTKSKTFKNVASSWQGSDSIVLSLFGKDLEGAEFDLIRDYANGSQKLRLSQFETDDYNKIQNGIKERVGIPAKDVFESSMFIKQAQVSNIQISKDLRNNLQNVSSLADGSTGRVNVEAGLKDLRDELNELERGLKRPAKNPGRIKATEDELGELKRQLAELRAEWQKFSQAKKSEPEAGGQLEETNKKIAELETLFDNYKKNEQGQKEIKQIEQSLKQISATLQTIRNSEAELKQIEAQLGTFPGFKKANLDELATILQGLMQRIKLAQEVIQDLEKDLAKTGESERLNYLQVSEQKQRGRDLLQLGGGGAAVGFVGFVVGVILSSLIIQILSAFLLIPGILVFFWGLVKSSGSSVISVSEGVESAEVRSLREQIVSQKERVELAKKEQQEIISQYGLEDSNQFFTQKARFAALKSEYERVQAVLSSQLGDKTAMQWQEEESKLLAQKKEIETNLLTEEVRAAALSPNDYLRQRRDLDMLLIERRKLEKDTTKNEIISETVTVSEEEINRLEEKKEILEQRLGNLNKRAAVLSKTIDYLEQVIKQTSKGASELVAQIAEQFLPRLTENRYKDIRLNENYDLEVFSSEKNDWVKPLDTLSLGTADQIYILARVALAKTILGGSLPYLFLDDPFVTFDSVRLGQMKEILQELASETQIFLFTHGEHYKDWGNLVEL